MKSNKSALFIDGENLRHYIEKVIYDNGFDKHKYSITDIDFSKLFTGALKNFNLVDKIYYSAKLQVTPETEKVSKLLVNKQRALKTKLEKNGYQFLIAGHVRPQTGDKGKVVFKEKGVDVRIAVDLVKSAFDKKYQSVILCSSDSDLQPAIKEARRRQLEIVYLGFETMPNKGLTFTTNRTILLWSSEIISAVIKRK
ncbi:NYN domain-containing protein [Candidatus Shapirobacteria bacterium]|nr:NYN domain-containing protein [Candidatus Shapirobacteria bacterium]